MVALRYAFDFDRARSLALVGTTAGPDAAVPDDVRVALLDDDPRASVEPLVTDELLADEDLVAQIAEWRARDDPPPAVHREQLAAAEAFDVADRLHEVTLPALVLHGTEDRVWPVEAGRRLAEGLPRGEFHPVERGPHLVTVEYARPVNDALLGFLETQSA